MSQTNLDELRTQISAVDQSILSLLAQRRGLTMDVAKTKIQQGKAVRDPKREEALLSQLIEEGNEFGLEAHYVTRLFHLIIEDSVLNQQVLLHSNANREQDNSIPRVAFLGTKGSYSYLAIHKYFSRRAQSIEEVSCKGFKAIIDAVESGQADFAALPIENTSSGSINEVYDLLQHTSLSIIGEQTVPVEHSLLVACDTQLDNIRTLYAHSQPYAQCSLFTSSLDNIETIYSDSTSSAMASVAELKDPSVAAIGSPAGGKFYDLSVLKTGIANQEENYSRFIIVSRKAEKVPHQVPAKTTFIMSTAQQPGALVEALMVLRENDINMTKLESRPIPGNPWEEMFYVDVEANLDAPELQTVLDALSPYVRFLKILGCYPCESVLPTKVSKHQNNESINLSSTEPLSPFSIKDVNFGRQHYVNLVSAPVGNPGQVSKIAQSVKEMGQSALVLDVFSATSDEQARLNQLMASRRTCDQIDLPLAVIVSDSNQLQTAKNHADILILSADAMYQQALLQLAGQVHKPVVITRATNASVEQWIEAASLVQTQGNRQIILCDAGVYIDAHKHLLSIDTTAMSLLSQSTGLPIIMDPSNLTLDQQQLEQTLANAKVMGSSGVLIKIDAAGEDPCVSGTNLTIQKIAAL